MTDLNSLTSSSGWTLSDATAINDNGWIAGYGLNPTGQEHAFLLTPIPEPSAFVLLSINAISLLALASRRRKRPSDSSDCIAPVASYSFSEDPSDFL